jgi:hypothetical protein
MPDEAYSIMVEFLRMSLPVLYLAFAFMACAS